LLAQPDRAQQRPSAEADDCLQRRPAAAYDAGMADVREATPDDLEPILRLARTRRRLYALYHPQLWRPAADAEETHRRLLGRAIADAEVIVLVAVDDGRVRGFVLARLVQSAAVYDPGGPTCFIDDFAVDEEGSWATLGVRLLRAAVVRAAARSATQVVVVAAHLDAARRRALRDAGLAVTSEWWVASIGRPLQPGETGPAD
jgi:GNAT superfamily N-acetyltransferase